MLEDAIIKELHDSREAHAKRFNYDVTAIVADLKMKEATLAHRLVQRPIKRHQKEILHHDSGGKGVTLTS